MTALAESAATALCCVMCPEPIDYVDQDSLLGFCHRCARLDKGKSDKEREEKKGEIKKKQKKTPEQGIQKPKKQREEKSKVVNLQSEEERLIAEAARLEREAEKARLQAEATRQALARILESREREKAEEEARRQSEARQQLVAQRMSGLIADVIREITALLRGPEVGLAKLNRQIREVVQMTARFTAPYSLQDVMSLSQSRQTLMRAYLAVLGRFELLCTNAIKPYTDTGRYSVILDSEPPAGEPYDLELILRMPGQLEKGFGTIQRMAHNFSEALADIPVMATTMVLGGGGDGGDYNALDAKLERTRAYVAELDSSLLDVFYDMDRLNVERERRYPKLISLVMAVEGGAVEDEFFDEIAATISALFEPYAFIFANTLALYHEGLLTFTPSRKPLPSPTITTTTTTTTTSGDVESESIVEEEEEEEDEAAIRREEEAILAAEEFNVDLGEETSDEETEEIRQVREKFIEPRLPSRRRKFPTKKGATIVDKVLIPDVEEPILDHLMEQFRWFHGEGYGGFTDFMIPLIGVMHHFKEAVLYTEAVANAYQLSLATFLFVHVRPINNGRDQVNDYLYDFTARVYATTRDIARGEEDESLQRGKKAKPLQPSTVTTIHINKLAKTIFDLIREEGQKRIHRLSGEEEAEAMVVWDADDPRADMFIVAARRILYAYLIEKDAHSPTKEPMPKELFELLEVDMTDVANLAVFLEENEEDSDEKKKVKEEEEEIRERIVRERSYMHIEEVAASTQPEPVSDIQREALAATVAAVPYDELLSEGLPEFGLSAAQVKVFLDAVVQGRAQYKTVQKSRKKKYTALINYAVAKAGIYLLIVQQLIDLMIRYGVLDEDYDLYKQYPGLAWVDEEEKEAKPRRRRVFVIHDEESSGEEDIAFVPGEEGEEGGGAEDTEYTGRGRPVVRYRRARADKSKTPLPKKKTRPSKVPQKKLEPVESEEEEEEAEVEEMEAEIIPKPRRTGPALEEPEPVIKAQPKKKPTREQMDRNNAARRLRRQQKKQAKSASSDVTPSTDGDESSTTSTTTTTTTTQQPQKPKRPAPKQLTEEEIAERKARKALNEKLRRARKKQEAEAQARGAPFVSEKEPMQPYPAIVIKKEEEEEEEPSRTEEEETEEEVEEIHY